MWVWWGRRNRLDHVPVEILDGGVSNFVDDKGEWRVRWSGGSKLRLGGVEVEMRGERGASMKAACRCLHVFAELPQ
jgi:hypothetical protein